MKMKIVSNNQEYDVTYKIYKKPRSVRKEDLQIMYKNGAVLFLQRTAVEDVYEIFGECKYIANLRRNAYAHVCAKFAELQNESYEFVIIRPFRQVQVKFDRYDIMSADDFYLKKSDEMEELFEEYANIYEASVDEIYLYYEEDRLNDGVIYYGSSCKSISKRAESKTQVDVITAEEYRKKCGEHRLMSKLNEANKEDKKKRESGNEIQYAIRRWINKTPFSVFEKVISDRVKGQTCTSYIAAEIYNYLECIAYGKKVNNSFLLAAPSGSGKTETYRALRDYFQQEIPEFVICQIDMTQITEEGYKGADTKDVVRALLEKPEQKGIGIVMLDEFDKKLIPSFSGKGQDVNKAVQSQLLTLIEGREVYANGGKGRMESSEEKIDTGNTLFIGMGAFDMCRKKKAEVIHHIGFTGEDEGGEKHYSEITREDMLEVGASVELLGRFGGIYNYQELEEEIVCEIADDICKRVGDCMGLTIRLTDQMKKHIVEISNSKYGCREIESIIHAAAFKKYVEIMKSELLRHRCTIIINAETDVSYIVDDGNPENEDDCGEELEKYPEAS